MSFKVEVKNTGENFVCNADKSILQTALDNGIALPFSCRSGMCMTCKGRIVEGKVSFGGAHEKYLTLEDRANGYALLCCATPLSNLVIDVPKASARHPSQKYPVRILSIKKMSEDVIELTLGLPPNQPIHFLPGQFVDILLGGDVRRSYSIACPPKAQGVRQLDFHIRHLPGGLFTDKLFNNIKPRDMLQIEAPLGSFYLRMDNELPMIMLASGTGFAPIKSILSTLAEKKSDRKINLYWGGRRKTDLYDLNFVESLKENLSGFKFIPVLSDTPAVDEWQGRTGFVHKAVIQDFPNMRNLQVYACGVPVMVEAARTEFTNDCQLNVENFYADSFITEAEKAKI